MVDRMVDGVMSESRVFNETDDQNANLLSDELHPGTEMDEKMQDALGLLFEQFWVLRTQDPAAYQFIREQEHKLKRYVSDKFGFELIVHQHFIKLEKIPVDPKPWMGMQSFTEPMDYALFCCGLAYTEQLSVDEQFLLSDLAEEIQDMYPGEFPLDWTNYRHRKSLVRALSQLVELNLIRTVDGDLEQFAMNEEEEVLYEATIYARYFMRSYPDDLFQYDSYEAILEAEWNRQQSDERRKRVYRKLMFSPVVYREGEEDPDFAYIRNFRNRLREDLEKHTPFRFELFKNAAMLVMPERKQRYTLFPDQRAISDVALHLADYVRGNMMQYDVNELGDLRLAQAEFEQLTAAVKARDGHGWSKAYREGSVKQIAEELLQLLQEWELASVEADTGMVILKAGFARMVGTYPRDYERSIQNTQQAMKDGGDEDERK